MHLFAMHVGNAVLGLTYLMLQSVLASEARRHFFQRVCRTPDFNFHSKISWTLHRTSQQCTDHQHSDLCASRTA